MAELKYQCNYVTAIEAWNFEKAGEHGNAYRVTTQKEIFPTLDKWHCIPTSKDAIFDYGCGKGGAMVSFLDYGFVRVGGIEFEPKIYDCLIDNIEKLTLSGVGEIECIQGDAAEVNIQLDQYNWFYFFLPFDNVVFKKCIDSICESMKRRDRKIHIISIAPKHDKIIEDTGYFE